MILDFTLALNALIWFATMILPLYGLITGYKRRRDLMMRASLLIVCLIVALLTLEVTLDVVAIPGHEEELSVLQGYRQWLFLGASGSLALGWALFVMGKALRGRK
ncbi:hypothetical protein [Shimia sagamensis]|uniref:Transmembrane protein n=1 Tax=Shimia sagamensis TaxID=1566352 RepID=A0ABY1NYL1_9RHOB|nr:hypothetical protein [Shimia sagamensis]SMP22213.1 hypothetical protein SAMN06265373_104132 [Shimia sagamensis]